MLLYVINIFICNYCGNVLLSRSMLIEVVILVRWKSPFTIPKYKRGSVYDDPRQCF